MLGNRVMQAEPQRLRVCDPAIRVSTRLSGDPSPALQRSRIPGTSPKQGSGADQGSTGERNLPQVVCRKGCGGPREKRIYVGSV